VGMFWLDEPMQCDPKNGLFFFGSKTISEWSGVWVWEMVLVDWRETWSSLRTSCPATSQGKIKAIYGL
jgi:hypothetical protein